MERIDKVYTPVDLFLKSVAEKPVSPSIKGSLRYCVTTSKSLVNCSACTGVKKLVWVLPCSSRVFMTFCNGCPLVDGLRKLFEGLLIAAAGFVKNQYLRAPEQRARNRDALLLPAR